MFVRFFYAKKMIPVFLSVFMLLIYVGSFCLWISVYENTSTDVIAASLNIDRFTIIIDAGHGGEDSGTIAKDGTHEKDYNLKISEVLGSMLESSGYSVIYTRRDDKLLYTEEENINGIRKISDLKNRVKIANQIENAIFVSIHMNSFTSEKSHGLQVYYGLRDDSSKILAGKIQSSVCRDLQTDNHRQIKEGNDIYVLENIEGTAVLIECGFLSNEEECGKLKEEEYQKKLCFDIVCGIVEYINEK